MNIVTRDVKDNKGAIKALSDTMARAMTIRDHVLDHARWQDDPAGRLGIFSALTQLVVDLSDIYFHLVEDVEFNRKTRRSDHEVPN